MTAEHKAKLSIAAISYHERTKGLCERVSEMIKVNPKIMLRQSYRASELKKMGLTHCGIKAPLNNEDQASIRRMSA